MSLPCLSLVLLCCAAVAAPSQAADFRAPALPSNLSAAPLAHAPSRHGEKPDPDGGGLSDVHSGPSPWIVAAVVLVASGGVTAGVAKAQDKRMREATGQPALDRAFSTQKSMAWTTVGLLGGAGVSFTLSKVL